MDLNLVVGGGVLFSEELYLGFKADINPFSMDLSSESDPLPERDGVPSLGGEGPFEDLRNTSSNHFTLDLYFILGI